VRRVGEAFAQTVDAKLAGEEVTPPQSFGAFTLLLQLVLDRLRALFMGSNGRRG
jgi:hypothetical protein